MLGRISIRYGPASQGKGCRKNDMRVFVRHGCGNHNVDHLSRAAEPTAWSTHEVQRQARV